MKRQVSICSVRMSFAQVVTGTGTPQPARGRMTTAFFRPLTLKQSRSDAALEQKTTYFTLKATDFN